MPMQAPSAQGYKAPAAKAKKKAMGMRSTQPRMQGPISGGAGGGFTQQPGPGTSGMPMPGKVAGYGGPSGWNPRGPMPLPPSAAPRPGMPPMGPPMRPGPPMGGPPPGQPFQGGGFQPPGQPPAGGAYGGPPPGMGDAQWSNIMADKMAAPRGIPGGEMPGAGGMDPRAQAMAQMQQAQARMGQMQKPPGMMGSVGPPPGPGGGMGPGGFDQNRMQQVMQQANQRRDQWRQANPNPVMNQMPAGRQAPDMAGAYQQAMAARGGQPQF